MFRRIFMAVLTSMVLLITACSSTGYSTKESLTVPQTIRAPASIPPEVAPYVPRYIDALQAKGFSVGATDDPRALDLVFEFNGNPFNLRVAVGLWRQGVPVLTGSATNSGWGTALARGTAVNSLAEKSVAQFKAELDAFMSHSKIVKDEQ